MCELFLENRGNSSPSRLPVTSTQWERKREKKAKNAFEI
jgi:hypothetical protein